jgi:plasmid stabilization system protein ParE
MAFRVELTRGAESDLESLERAILSLGEHPERCPIAAESFDPKRPVRALLHGRSPHRYRVFHTVDRANRILHVVHIRHAARRPAASAVLGRRRVQ